ANVSGRAGRAFVDIEGIVLHIIKEKDQIEEERAERKWEDLILRAKAPAISSGLLQLAETIFHRISDAVGVPLEETIEYITGHGDAWDLTDSQAEQIHVKLLDWERDIASLDAAILALLDISTEENCLDAELNLALDGSLFSRQLARQEQMMQTLLKSFVVARARNIWTQTSASQRRGYHVAGVGLRAGQFLDANITNLVSFLLQADAAVAGGDSSNAANAIVEFAKLIFQTKPFSPSKSMPNAWENALRKWVEGQLASEIVGVSSDSGVDLLQDAFSYRLPWAMEAVRVHAIAIRQKDAEQINGHAAMAVEVGSANRTVIKLLRAGLNSRDAAIVAVATTGASFVDHAGMIEWIRSEQVELLSNASDWPTSQSRHAWLQFFDSRTNVDRLRLTRQTQVLKVEWFIGVPPVNTRVIVEPGAKLVLTTDWVRLGILKTDMCIQSLDVVNAWVGDKLNTVVVEYFGPPTD
ncbi:MAG: hypothetical protein M0Q13_11575, partial [Methanothrix sp.]|nr:hypothetical protein [Methanothrix sp.]